MNTQMFFVETADRESLLKSVEDRLASVADAPNSQPNWGLESSYDRWIANDPNRKVAISPVRGGWIAAIESKEVLDFALLQRVSVLLACKVVACQLAGTIDSCGYACCRAGSLLETAWVDNDTDPIGTLRSYLRSFGIEHDLMSFRDAIRGRSNGWDIRSRRK